MGHSWSSQATMTKKYQNDIEEKIYVDEQKLTTHQGNNIVTDDTTEQSFHHGF